MSWNNVIPNRVIHDILNNIRKEPKQLHFDEDVFPPCFYIDEEYLVSCNEAFTWIKPTGGNQSGTISKSVDHPAFTALREHLYSNRYINKVTSYVNGDRVLKPFYLNDVYFDKGDKFVCASAMSGELNFRRKYGKG